MKAVCQSVEEFESRELCVWGHILVVTIQYMLGIFIIAAVAVHENLSSRELLGLGGKQGKNICSIHKSD